jgi:23S rRNA pseudouridine2605 synthase
VRLQKLLAAAGVASRRAAEALLRAGRVSVNGRPAQLGDSARPGLDRVAVDGRPVARPPLDYWMLHKPRGVLTSVRDPHGRPTVVDLLPSRERRLFPVGRLDLDSEGLVLLTNDGELAHVLLHPSHETEREYRVSARGRVPAAALRRLARGVELEDGRTAPARVGRARFDARADQTHFALTLVEGRKRQIRRALAALGHPVVRLVRVRMGPLRLGGLPSGRARPLSRDERRALRRLRESAAQPSEAQRRPGRYGRSSAVRRRSSQ